MLSGSLYRGEELKRFEFHFLTRFWWFTTTVLGCLFLTGRCGSGINPNDLDVARVGITFPRTLNCLTMKTIWELTVVNLDIDRPNDNHADFLNARSTESIWSGSGQ